MHAGKCKFYTWDPSNNSLKLNGKMPIFFWYLSMILINSQFSAWWWGVPLKKVKMSRKKHDLHSHTIKATSKTTINNYTKTLYPDTQSL